jgi:DNA-binding NarL/FixJ family response regulator
MSSTSIISPPRDGEPQTFVGRNGKPATPRNELDLLLVDDHLAARYSVWALLRWKRDIREIATAASSSQALRLAMEKRRRPRVCLISATLGDGEALTLASRIKHLMHPPRVLIFADAIDAHHAGAAMLAGADGVLWRYADPQQQARVIRRVAGGQQHFPNLRSDEVRALLDHVEDRDRPIVAMLLERTPRDEIARTLGISARAVERRRQSILKRLSDTRTRDDDGRHGEGSPSGRRDCQPPSRSPIRGELTPRAW